MHLWPMPMHSCDLHNAFLSQDSKCMLMLYGKRASKIESAWVDIRGFEVFLGLNFSLFFDGTR